MRHMNRALMVGIAAAALAAAKDQGSKAVEIPTLPEGVTGNDLLTAINSAPNGEMLLTEGQASEGIAAGLLIADTTRAADGRAPVALTDAGRARLSAPASAPAASSSGYEIDDNVPMPTDISKRRGGRGGGYPFEALNVGQSFHVAVSAKMPKPWESLTSTVSGARAKFAEETGETKEVTVATYAKDANGKFVMQDGKRVKTGETKETRPVTKLTRDFKVVQVGDADPRGPGARVYRTA